MQRIIALIGYLLIAILIIFLYLDYQASKPVSFSAESKTLIIEKGESFREISQKLEKEGLIKDKTVFILYSFLKNLRRNFLPGKYELKKNLTLKEIIQILTSPPKEKQITIIEGWSVQEIASYLEKEGLVKKDDFLEEIKKINNYKDKYEFLKDEKINTLEGFLFPDTYRVYLDSDSHEIITKMLDNFDKKLDKNLREEILRQKKTIYEIIILASIVEKEVSLKEDRYLVADIFWRRLKNNIPLQADSTINYFTGKKQRQASPEDLKIDNPYNTYRYRGLPPGPISNPGLDSILAVIYPQKNDWWYFLNKDDGTTVYSRTFEEHKANKMKYLKNKESFDKPRDYFKKGEWLVKYKNDDQIYKIVFNSEKDIEKFIFRSNAEIEIIEPNYIYKASFLEPNDPFFKEQWFLKKIGAPAAWDLVGGGSESIVIALLDSGIDIDHPDLKDNIWQNQKEIPNDGIDNDNNGYIDDVYGWDFIENKPDPRPKFYPSYTISGINHGTVLAGVAAASGQNNQGIIGLAWKTKIMPIRVLNNRGEGTLENIIKGIEYAIKNKADIINLSFVGPNKSELLTQVIKKAWESNILIIAAAGNNPETEGIDLNKNPLYPICLDADLKENIILGVTATNEFDKKTLFANYGNRCVDLAAPGSKIFSTLFHHPFKSEFKEYYGGYWSGTSVAAPLVSATAALIKSLYPLASNREIRNIILETVDKIDPAENREERLGKGRINVYQAVLKTYQKLITVPHYRYLVTGPGTDLPPLIKIFRPTGLKITEFYAYDKKFRGGVNLTAADLYGDQIKEIITVPKAKGGPHLRIFNSRGELVNQFFVYDEEFRGGVTLAAGDLDNDGLEEIVVGPQKGNLPLRVIDRNGKVISEFYAYDKKFKGGVSLAVCDLDGDGLKEIITGAGPGGGPQVRIFDLNGRVKDQFFAYHKDFRGGINVACGDLNRDGLDEIVVSVASRASPYVRIFNNFFHLKAQFLAYDRNFYGGVSITTEDLDGDGKKEIITTPFQGGGPHIRIFNDQGELKGQFFAYDKSFNKGLAITAIKKFE
ncbi:MAG: endolytic transglycosylase MltG [Patescibacteria group bacterium]